jgi:hypothetical protein
MASNGPRRDDRQARRGPAGAVVHSIDLTPNSLLRERAPARATEGSRRGSERARGPSGQSGFFFWTDQRYSTYYRPDPSVHYRPDPRDY